MIATTITVKAIPEDVIKFILKIQGNIKSQKGIGTYSQSQTVIHIIKEYQKKFEK